MNPGVDCLLFVFLGLLSGLFVGLGFVEIVRWFVSLGWWFAVDDCVIRLGGAACFRCLIVY